MQAISNIPNKIGNGDWKLISSKHKGKDLNVIYRGNWLDNYNDSIMLSISLAGTGNNSYVLNSISLMIGESFIYFRSYDFWDMPFSSRDCDIHDMNNIGIYVSEMLRRLGFEYFDWESERAVNE